MSFTASIPQLSQAWAFENSNVDYITNLSPSSQVSPGPSRIQGSVSLVSNAPTGNTAVYFPGVTGSYILLGSTSPVHFDTGTSNLFVESWVNFSQNAYTEYIAGVLNTALGTNDDWGLRVDGTYNRFMAYHYNTLGSSTAVTAPASTPVIKGTWYHVAASFTTTGIIYLYVNGVLQNAGGTSIGGTPRYTAASSAFVGTPSPLPNGWVATNGYIRDLRVIKGGVIPTASFTPNSAPFSWSLPNYVTGGSIMYNLLGQFVTYNPIGKYSSSLVINNNPAWNASNIYSVYPVLLNSTNTFSVSFWTKILTTKPNGLNYTSIIGFRGRPVSNNAIINYFDINQAGNNSFLGFYGQNGNILSQDYSPSAYSTTVPVAGTWYHVAWVVNSSNFTFYVNGIQSASTPAVGNTFTLTNMYFGTTGQFLSAQSYSGEIDDLRIYSSALTASQVQTIYRAQGMPSRGTMVNTVGTVFTKFYNS